MDIGFVLKSKIPLQQTFSNYVMFIMFRQITLSVRPSVSVKTLRSLSVYVAFVFVMNYYLSTTAQLWAMNLDPGV